jgi:hypothetical protein
LKIKLLDIDPPYKGKYQFYLDWFKDAWVKEGGLVKPKHSFPYLLRMAVAKLRMGRNLVKRKEKALLVTGGAYLDFSSFPYNFSYDIVPVFWDTWSRYQALMISSLRRNKVKIAFFTQNEVAELVRREIPEIRTFWVPEGIQINNYHKGKTLTERTLSVLQYGRKYEKYHEKIKSLNKFSISYKYQNNRERVFTNFNEFTLGLSDTAISICFPRSLTDPIYSGGIETLTQRYWESMLSGCLIVGKAPNELIKLMGYNPVIEVDWVNPVSQLLGILDNLENYQELVERNYKIALEICPWEKRMADIIKTLKKEDYYI